MSETSPLAQPEIWSSIADGYTSELLPHFTLYARDAIRLAQLPADADVIDVATGPGTLALEVAPQARRVVAVDFAEGMVEQLRRKVESEGIGNIEALRGNGEALPFEDASFDAAFSMFGLIFFPDRAAGFRELARVLRPGGSAVVSSWAPMDNVPLLAVMYGTLAELLPDLFAGRVMPPLSDATIFHDEMMAGGFGSVEVHTVAHTIKAPSVTTFWESNLKSAAFIVLLKNRLEPAEWDRIEAEVLSRLTGQFGTGPIESEWPARLGVGIR